MMRDPTTTGCQPIRIANVPPDQPPKTTAKPTDERAPDASAGDALKLPVRYKGSQLGTQIMVVVPAALTSPIRLRR